MAENVGGFLRIWGPSGLQFPCICTCMKIHGVWNTWEPQGTTRNCRELHGTPPNAVPCASLQFSMVPSSSLIPSSKFNQNPTKFTKISMHPQKLIATMPFYIVFPYIKATISWNKWETFQAAHWIPPKIPQIHQNPPTFLAILTQNIYNFNWKSLSYTFLPLFYWNIQKYRTDLKCCLPTMAATAEWPNQDGSSSLIGFSI